MLQADDLNSTAENTDTGHENLSLADIQELIKQEKCEAEELASDDDIHRITEEQFEKNSEGSPSKSKKSGNVKRARLQKLSKAAKKKVLKPATQYERLSNRELLVEMIKNEIMESDVRPVHTCKFCHRNFSSAFILCLHIQIHEKVNSVSKMCEQNKATAADSSETVSQPVKNVNTVSSVDKIESSPLKNVNKKPTVSQVENVQTKNTDSSTTVDEIVSVQKKKVNQLPNVSKNVNIETPNIRSDGCSSSSSGSSNSGRVKIKTEAIEEGDSISIKSEPVSFVKNNFVENLKKNLSLAMNRKL